MQENRAVPLELKQMEKATGGVVSGDPRMGTDGIKCPSCGQPLKFTFTGGYRCTNAHCSLFTEDQGTGV